MPDWDKLAAEWLTKPAWTHVRITQDPAAPADRPEEFADMILSIFDSLDEYSCTLPTGTVIHKRWRRDDDEQWWLGEYAEHEDPEKVRIIWRRIRVHVLPSQALAFATHATINALRTVEALT